MGSTELTAHSTAAQTGPDCASCHGYLLNDSNHLFHLLKADSNKAVNGSVTCLDCHSTAIAFRVSPILDSIFVDSFGGTWSSLDYPKSAGIRAFRLERVDTVQQHRPIPLPARPGAKPLYQEYVTALAHCNNVVDVVFDSRITDSVKYSGAQARYDAKQQTCSAVACHERENPYRWAAPSKGLSGLKGD
ncbi:MAG: hypothetical protein JWO30_4315 [Fibrobacteres bacterium]|nr:hypothetical protein [Fibrobacterota bacterium]